MTSHADEDLHRSSWHYVLRNVAISSKSRWQSRSFKKKLSSAATISILLTVSNLAISTGYPAGVQSLARGVFNEIGQIGISVRLAIA